MDAETMRRRAGELVLNDERELAWYEQLSPGSRRRCAHFEREVRDRLAILRAVAAGYIVTDTPDGLVPAEYMREGTPVLVLSPDGVGNG